LQRCPHEAGELARDGHSDLGCRFMFQRELAEASTQPQVDLLWAPRDHERKAEVDGNRMPCDERLEPGQEAIRSGANR
jgi:hypothetical protein